MRFESKKLLDQYLSAAGEGHMDHDSNEISLGAAAVAFPFMLLLSAPIAIATAVLNGFVIFKIWGWYLSGHFGPPQFAMSFGIALIGRFVAYQGLTQSRAPRDLMQRAGDSVLVPMIALFAGWVGTFFIH